MGPRDINAGGRGDRRSRAWHVHVEWFVHGFVHVAQHVEAADAEEADGEPEGGDEEDDVEDRGRVPLKVRLHYVAHGHVAGVPLRLEVEGGEEEFDDEGGDGHGDVEEDEQQGGDADAVVLAIDIEDGED